MKKRYLIDGNNLLHKFPKNKLNSSIDDRIALALKIDNYFYSKNISCTVIFDGFKKESIKTNKIKIEYSNNFTADEIIRNEIERAKNTRLLTVISSDNEIIDLARVCSCEVIKSEDFVKMLQRDKDNLDEEKKIINKLNFYNWNKMFGE